MAEKKAASGSKVARWDRASFDKLPKASVGVGRRGSAAKVCVKNIPTRPKEPTAIRVTAEGITRMQRIVPGAIWQGKTFVSQARVMC